MKHIISNPHNGSPVDVHGITLAPGYEIEVKQEDAEDLKKSFDFLAYSIVKGNSTPQGAKAKKLKEHLEWSHVTAPDSDPAPQFVVHGTKPKTAKAPKKVAAPKAKKTAKK